MTPSPMGLRCSVFRAAFRYSAGRCSRVRSYTAVFGFLFLVGATGFLLAASMLNTVRAFRPAGAVELASAGVR